MFCYHMPKYFEISYIGTELILPLHIMRRQKVRARVMDNKLQIYSTATLHGDSKGYIRGSCSVVPSLARVAGVISDLRLSMGGWSCNVLCLT